jgi:hypothetical protein
VLNTQQGTTEEGNRWCGQRGCRSSSLKTRPDLRRGLVTLSMAGTGGGGTTGEARGRGEGGGEGVITVAVWRHQEAGEMAPTFELKEG